ncbi:MAG: GNAT family N-acetyltransferase [Bacteroidaceae bacterium]
MMELQLRTYTKSADIPDLPITNVFYRKELFQVYECTPHYKPILIVVAAAKEKEDGKVLSALLGVVHRGENWRSLLRRCEVYGTGEYFTEDADFQEELFGMMLAELTNEAIKKAWMISFRNLEDPLFGYREFRQQKYFSIKWMRVLNKFSLMKEIIETANHSRRRQIRKALHSSCKIEEATSREDINAFSIMLRRNYSSKVRRHFPSIRFFEEFYKKLSKEKMGSIYIVRYHEHIIGGSVVLYNKDRAYLIFNGGMNRTCKSKYPGVLSVWKALHEARARGCHDFEYIDAGLPFRTHGLRDFALRFGARPQSSRRWFRLRINWLNSLLTLIYR